MIFEQIATGGCQSYLIGCGDTCAAALIDPEISQIDRYLALAARDGLRIRYLIDTHTHADHFSATRQLARQLDVPVVMHRASPAPFVDMRLGDGEMIVLGKPAAAGDPHAGAHARLDVPEVEDRVFTGDTLLIGAHRPHRPAERRSGGALRQPVQRLLKLDPALKVYPAHDYKGRGHSTIGAGARRRTRACRSASAPPSSR